MSSPAYLEEDLGTKEFQMINQLPGLLMFRFQILIGLFLLLIWEQISESALPNNQLTYIDQTCQ